jgi:flagellar biosynthesis/type III secretory pathway M-ring protein FliF/YscJ
VIETLPFETTLQIEPPVPPAAAIPAKPGAPVVGIPLPLALDKKTLLIAGGALAGVLVLGIVLALFRRKRRKVSAGATASAPATLPSGTPGSSVALAVPGQVESQMESQLAERDALQAKADAQALSSLKLAPVITKKAEVFAKHLRDKIAKEPEISVQILRGWIREEEEN